MIALAYGICIHEQAIGYMSSGIDVQRLSFCSAANATLIYSDA